MPAHARRPQAFAMLDALALVVIAGALGSIAMVANPATKARESSKQLKDATQIRGIGQGVIVWATNNKDQYPIPGNFDKENATVADKGNAKNTTAAIYSILVWNASLTPELLVSPLENNPKIKPHAAYTFLNPNGAVKPNIAQWDPSLSGDMNSAVGGHISYAHLQPAGDRLKRWSDTYDASHAQFAYRGPQITASTVHDEFTATPTFANDKSLTFNVYTHAGKPGSWSGNVAFADNHVEFIANHFTPKAKTETGAQYTTAKGEKRPDLAFFDESDDPASTNNFLGIFIKAGDKPADYLGAWD